MIAKISVDKYVSGEAVVIDEVPLSTLISDFETKNRKTDTATSSCGSTVSQYHQLDEKGAGCSSSSPRQSQLSASLSQASSTRVFREYSWQSSVKSFLLICFCRGCKEFAEKGGIQTPEL